MERAYRLGALHVVTATSTLAAGINLPARRVVLRSLKQGIGPVSRSQYLQVGHHWVQLGAGQVANGLRHYW